MSHNGTTTEAKGVITHICTYMLMIIFSVVHSKVHSKISKQVNGFVVDKANLAA